MTVFQTIAIVLTVVSIWQWSAYWEETITTTQALSNIAISFIAIVGLAASFAGVR